MHHIFHVALNQTNQGGIRISNSQSCLPALFHHHFLTSHARQASYECSCLILILASALRVKTSACSFQQLKNLTHLSPTFRIKTFLSWILITSCLEFLSDWICEMCAPLTSSHCCSWGEAPVLISWDSDEAQLSWQQFSQSAPIPMQHTQWPDSLSCRHLMRWNENCQMLTVAWCCSTKVHICAL